jgi:hypothetical protein
MWGANFGVSKGPPEENKKTAYVLAPALQNSQRCGESENSVERQPHTYSKSKFLQKISGERFGLGRPLYCLLLLAGFFRLSELTGPDGLAKENRPNCPALGDFD